MGNYAPIVALRRQSVLRMRWNSAGILHRCIHHLAKEMNVRVRPHGYSRLSMTIHGVAIFRLKTMEAASCRPMGENPVG